MCPGPAVFIAPRETEGAGKAGCPPHPRPVCIGSKHTVVTTGVAGIIRPSLRNGFNGFLRALPGDRAFLPPSPARCEASSPAWPQRREARTTRLRRPLQAPLVSRRQSVHRIPLHVRDDRDTPLLPRRDAQKINLIWVFREAIYFSQQDWTGFPPTRPPRLGKNFRLWGWGGSECRNCEP
jgi:hypothetical protein